MKKVYLGMSADILHKGHINIINEGAKLGEVTVGVLTDSAIASYKRIPYMKFEDRCTIIKSLKGVKNVVAQESLDYSDNLNKLKPDFVVHGDDWKAGVQKKVRDKVIDLISNWGGKVVDIPYTSDISSSQLQKMLKGLGTTPDIRRSLLRRQLLSKDCVRFLDTHNGLSALIVENTKILDSNDNVQEFDGMWASSLTESCAKGKPDIEAVDVTSRLQSVNEMLEVSTKPIIYDADTGGKIEHFEFTVRTLERLGVSAVIIEDKTGLKKNSLLGNEVPQQQDSIEDFSRKIIAGKDAQITDDFMIIARIESLILEKGIEDAINRAKAFIAAGADGIMIHSRQKKPDEIIDFCKKLRKINEVIPIIAVPSSYNTIYEDELIKVGVNIIIYANQLLRAAYPAMLSAAKSILDNKRSYEIDDSLLSIKEILKLIPGTE